MKIEVTGCSETNWSKTQGLIECPPHYTNKIRLNKNVMMVKTIFGVIIFQYVLKLKSTERKLWLTQFYCSIVLESAFQMPRSCSSLPPHDHIRLCQTPNWGPANLGKTWGKPVDNSKVNNFLGARISWKKLWWRPPTLSHEVTVRPSFFCWWILGCVSHFETTTETYCWFSASTWNLKHPIINGCFNWMIPNHYLKHCCFTKHPLKTGCLGYQVDIFRSHQLKSLRGEPLCKGFFQPAGGKTCSTPRVFSLPKSSNKNTWIHGNPQPSFLGVITHIYGV